MNRRKFISQATVSTAGIGMATVLSPKGWIAGTAPSDTLNVALIGCNSMGFGDLQNHLDAGGVNCLAMCDVDENVLNKRAAEIGTGYGQHPKLFKDFRKMLEMKEIDAVIIGTPDHWHCLIAVNSMGAGKDVYVEKPMANSIGECNVMVKAAKRFNRIVQVGQQQRSGFIFQKAMELIKSGKIGNLRKVNIWANFDYGVGEPIIPDEPVPAGVDYDMWLGPAPVRPFNRNRFHGSWRHFWDYGGGLMTDWGVHLLDIGLWAKDVVSAPDRVLTYAANTFHEKRSRETFDSMTVTYPKADFVINWDMTAGLQQGPYDMSYGIAFIGDNATIVANRSKINVYPEWDEEQKKLRAEKYAFTEGTESHKIHARNFIECVKSRQQPACPPEIGRVAALHAHIPNIAARVEEPVLLWDDANNRFTNSAAANELVTPIYRKPWELPAF
jgi:predicted dehydrogenase